MCDDVLSWHKMYGNYVTSPTTIQYQEMKMTVVFVAKADITNTTVYPVVQVWYGHKLVLQRTYKKVDNWKIACEFAKDEIENTLYPQIKFTPRLTDGNKLITSQATLIE
jgi:hypothetical protein